LVNEFASIDRSELISGSVFAIGINASDYRTNDPVPVDFE
jgi:hypothetical protein